MAVFLFDTSASSWRWLTYLIVLPPAIAMAGISIVALRALRKG